MNTNALLLPCRKPKLIVVYENAALNRDTLYGTTFIEIGVYEHLKNSMYVVLGVCGFPGALSSHASVLCVLSV